MKNEGHERSVFLFLKSENRIEKSCFYQELWLFENSIHIFNFVTKNTDASKILGTWQLFGIFFQKLLWCTTTVPNLLFAAYPYADIWTTGKNDPQTQPHSSSSNLVHSCLLNCECDA